MTEQWPWLALAGLGMFHGVNPAMGWLFAVALGLHRGSRNVVLAALAPIAFGHVAATALVALAVVGLGVFVEPRLLRLAGGALLIGWAIYHALRGHRHRVRFGMQTSYGGLAAWSFLMAGAHGAGLMLVPALIPLCLAATPAGELLSGGSLATALLAIGVHGLAMLAVTGLVALVVYDRFGLAFLRRGWINLDVVWVVALIATGNVLLFS
jgi:hypothetical protein